MRMKAPFTMLQTALTLIINVVFAACIAGNLLLLKFNPDNVDRISVLFNSALCIVLLLVADVLIFKPSLTGIVCKNDNNDDTTPALRATRTYICIISFDAAVVLFLVIFGTVYLNDAIFYILIAAPLIFIVGAVKYIFDTRKIGVISDNDNNDE